MLLMLVAVCFRLDSSPCSGPEPAWFRYRLPECHAVSWAWMWCGWQDDAGRVL